MGFNNPQHGFYRPTVSGGGGSTSIINSPVTGTGIDTDPTLAANSDTLLASQRATKSYVDTVATGLDPKQAVRLATTGVLPAVTYANGTSGVGATLTADAVGALTIDSVAVALNDRILVKNQAASLQNGIYKVTTLGTGGVAFVLTRTTDADTSAELEGAYVFVTAGTVNVASAYVCTTAAPVIGTDPISFTQFAGSIPSTVALLPGRAGGQTLNGGTASGENLTLVSTANATKGKVLIGTNILTVDEVNSRVGVGQTVPLFPLHVVNSGANVLVVERNTTSGSAQFGTFYNPNTTDTNSALFAFTTDTTGVGATTNQALARFGAIFDTHDHATRSGQLIFQTVLNGTNTTRLTITSAGNLGVSSGTKIIPSSNTTTAIQVAQTDGTVFAIFDSTNKRLGIGAATAPSQSLHITNGHIRMDQVAAAGAPTVAVGAAGVLTGAYQYRITFVTSIGETEAGTASSVVNPSSQQVDLSAIPVSADSTVTSRKIYRTKVGAANTNMQLVTTIADNTTTVYSDNIADGSLTTNIPFKNTTGGNIFVGTNRVMYTDTTFTGLGVGVGNGTAIGGSQSVSIGSNSLGALTTGTNNVAIGYLAAQTLTTSSNVTAIGRAAGNAIVSGNSNTYVGSGSGLYNQTGSNNTWVGQGAGQGVVSTSNANNTGVGATSGSGITTGSSNVLIGFGAGSNITTGQQDVILGYNIQTPAVGTSNFMSIGNLLFSAGIDGTGTTLSTGNLGIGVAAPATKLHTVLTDAGTAAVVNVATLAHRSSGTPAASFGTGLLFTGDSSTNTDQPMGRIRTHWSTATDATRKSRMTLSVFDTSERDGICIDAQGNFVTTTINGAQTSSRLAVFGNGTYGSWSTTGVALHIDGNSQTDSTGSGTIAFRTSSSFAVPTLLASSAETLTLSTNVYIAGAPVASTNVTQTKAAALVVDSGAAASVGLIVRAAAAQTAALYEALNSSGTVIFRVNSGGNISVVGGDGAVLISPSTFNLSSAGASAIVQNNTSSANSPLLLKSGSNAGTGSYVGLWAGGAEQLRIDNATVTWTDAINMTFGTTTGTKIGGATSQKLGFWNASPIVQPTTAITAASFTANTSGIANDTATFDGYTIGQIVAALRSAGLLA